MRYMVTHNKTLNFYLHYSTNLIWIRMIKNTNFIFSFLFSVKKTWLLRSSTLRPTHEPNIRIPNSAYFEVMWSWVVLFCWWPITACSSNFYNIDIYFWIIFVLLAVRNGCRSHFILQFTVTNSICNQTRTVS